MQKHPYQKGEIMRTKEFIKRVEELGFDVEIHKRCIKISRKNLIIAGIITNKRYSLNVFNPFDEEWENGDELLDLLVEYAKTPTEEREEEKKFYLEHRYFRFYNGSSKYLGMDLLKDKPDLYSKIAYEWVKNQFTLKEIEEIKEKFDTDLADFELVEVEE